MSRCDFKIVLLGSEHVGKTSLVIRFVNCRFNENIPYQNTVGAAFCAKTMESGGKIFNVGIWDTAGSERYEAMTRIYYRGAHAAVICYEPTSLASWTRLRHWMQELRTVEEYRDARAAVIFYEPTSLASWTRLRHWMQELRTVKENCKVYLCGTKKDILDEDPSLREVPEDTVKTYSLGLHGHYLTSSKTGENVDELFQKIVDDCAADLRVMRDVEETRLQLQREQACRDKSKEYCFC